MARKGQGCIVSRFRTNSILNLIFNYSNVVFNLVTGIFLVPFYLRKIPMDAYGSFLAAIAIAGLIGLLEFGLSMVLTQRLAKSFAQSDWPVFRRTVHAGLVAATLLFATTCLLTFAVVSFVPTLTRIPAPYQADLRMAFLLLGVAAGGSIYLNLFGSIFQALLKAGTLGLVNLLSATVGILTVVLAFHWQGSLAAIAAGTFARVLCATMLLLINAVVELHKRSLLPRVAPVGEAVALLRSCAPIFLGSVTKSIAENTQNLLLANAISPAAIAIFSLTQKAMQVCNMVLAPIGSSIYSNLTQIKAKTKEAYFSSLLGISIRSHFLLSVVLIGTSAVFNEPFMTLWVGIDKFGGHALSLMLGVSTLIVSRFSFFSFLIYSTGEFKKPLMLEACYSFTKIFLLFILVPQGGLLAVPIADIAAGFIFLYGFSTRLMTPHVSASPFGTGIYLNGWIEFVAIAALGHVFVTRLGSHSSWWMLGFNATLFIVVVTLCTLAFNSSFIKGVRAFHQQQQLAPS